MSKRDELFAHLDTIMEVHGGTNNEGRPWKITHAAAEIWRFIDVLAPKDAPDPLAPAWVTMDGMTPAFRCYLPGERWNGWDCPWFGEVALRQLAHYIRSDEEWNAEGVLTEHEGNPPETRWEYEDRNAEPYNGKHYLPVNADHKNAAGEAEAIWDFSAGMCWLSTDRRS